MRPIPVPATLVLSDQVWAVITHPNRRRFRAAQRRFGRDAAGRLKGFCAYGPREIHLAPHDDARELGRTFLHELLHACGAGRAERGGPEEEQFVRQIEDPLATVIEGMLSAEARP